MISPSRLDDDSWNFYDFSSTISPAICRQSLVRRSVFSLVSLLLRPWPYRVAPAVGKSCGAHIYPIPCCLCIPCTMAVQQMSQLFQHQSTARISFQVGRSVLLNKDYYPSTCSSSKIHGQGGNAWNPLKFDNQSAAIFLCGYRKILFPSKRSKPFRGN